MLTPNETIDKTITVGKAKAGFSPAKILLLSIFAGAFIALAGVGATFGNFYVGKLAGAVIFPVGLMMVVIAGSELFTGNNLMVVAAAKREITWRKLFSNWALVLLGNFIGAMLVTVLTVYSGVLDQAAELVINTAVAKNNLGFVEALFRGILCNFLVCIAVWMAFMSDTLGGKVAAIFGPIMLFVLCGFEHSIANMFYGPAGILMSLKTGIATNLTPLSFFLQNLIPVIIGNIVGGAVFVGLGYLLAYSEKTSEKKCGIKKLLRLE